MYNKPSNLNTHFVMISTTTCPKRATCPIHLDGFIALLRAEYARIGLPLPSKVETTRYSDLVYTARLQAVVEATKGSGTPFTLDEFDNVVNGRMTVALAHQYIKDRIALRPTLIQIEEPQSKDDYEPNY